MWRARPSRCSHSTLACPSTSSTAPSAAGRARPTAAPTAEPSAASACRGPSSTAASSTTTAVGRGANPPKAGTPGGGNGGAIYNDGNTMTLRVDGSTIKSNRSNGEGGSAIFFVSNDRSGEVEIVGLGPARQQRRRVLHAPRHLLPRPQHHLHRLRRRVAPGTTTAPSTSPTAASSPAPPAAWPSHPSLATSSWCSPSTMSRRPGNSCTRPSAPGPPTTTSDAWSSCRRRRLRRRADSRDQTGRASAEGRR